MAASIWNPSSTATPISYIDSIYLNVKDSTWGAIGDGVTDDTVAIQSAITYLETLGKGGVVFLPAGKYKITSPLLITWPNLTSGYDLGKVVIRGAGAGISYIEDYRTDVSVGGAISYDFSSGVTNDHYLDTWTGGFSITRMVDATVIDLETQTYTTMGTGVGFYANRIPDGVYCDMMITGYTTCMSFVDCLGYTIRDVYAHECEYGLALSYGSFSVPTSTSLTRVMTAACRTWGIKILGGSVSLTGCIVESNGLMAATSGGVYYKNDHILSLPKGLTINQCFFENNRGAADVYIETPTATTVEIANSIRDSVFARNSGTTYVTNNIYVLATGTTRMNLVVENCGFKGYNTYTESAGRKYIGYAGTLTNINPVYIGNTYTSALAAPVNRDLSASVASMGFGTGLAYITADGDNLDLAGTCGVVPGLGFAPKDTNVQYLGGSLKRWSELFTVLADISGDITWNSIVIPKPVSGVTTVNANLLLHFEGTSGSTTFTDSSTYAKSATRYGDAALSNLHAKFGTCSLLTSSGYIDFSSHADLVIGTQDFTVECFVYSINNSDAHARCLIDYRSGGAGWYLTTESDKLHLTIGGGATTSGTGTLSIVAFDHIAVVRLGTSLKVYLNGVADISVTNSTNFTATGLRVCDSTTIVGSSYNGYVDDFRVLVGTAVYTGAFTPPAVTLASSVSTTVTPVTFLRSDGTWAVPA